ncbi:TolC family protein [Pyxidicoccus sp. MSG2]|uniref:TolC family protein n=1 Tax=Pyxidicoccus sp. MSG2 TaxID=2996790 RepID=UPI00226EB156|nr:TolC family protein [Pyxidicoccus sp. MSG2]MCY1017881.1 TolC family protein [Pyxidicoccus sp. MSG2]
MAFALEHSPHLLSVRAQSAAARARVEGAGLLFQQNPEVSAAVGPRTRPGGNSVDLGLGVSQRLEVFGQRAARKDVARAELTASDARLATARIDLAADVREAFALARAAEQEALLAEEGRALAEQALQAAEERRGAGAASLIEVNTARVEQGRATRERTLALQRRSSALAQLRLLLGLEPTEALTLEGGQDTERKEAPLLAALQEKALAQRGEVQAAAAEVEAARAAGRLAAREVLPSPRLGATYSREEDATIIQGTLGIELPLFNRNQAARGESAARRVEAEGTLRAVEQLVRSEVALALERYRTASAAADVYSADVLAALQQNLELVNEAYRAGKVDFLQLLVIRRESLDARRGYIDAVRELAAADAQLTRAIGSLP